MEAVFIDGKPAKITIHDFRRYHLQSFPKLRSEDYDNLITDAIDSVYTIFYGVATGWDLMPEPAWFDKTRRCYLLLTAWFIAEKYPALVSGAPSIDGLRQKKVDGVSLTFDTGMVNGKADGTYQDALAALQSNHFGRTALIMIRSMPRRWLLRNAKYV